MFCENGAYTTVTSAVVILMVITLVFSSAIAVWSASKSADVQISADATAMAGANVVASYHTVATVVDASVLSLGLTGFAMAGVGLVGMLIPGLNAAATKTFDAGVRIIKMRNNFASSASKGLQKLEKTIPFLAAVQGTRVCDAQDTDSANYTGTALALPFESASEFPAIDSDQVSTDDLESKGTELDSSADELAKAAEKTAKAKEAAWIADCGRDGMNMQERASRLSGIDLAQNPDFESSITWDPNIALDRTRAYYTWRHEHDRPEGSSIEAKADAAARKAFYGYAAEQFADAHVYENNGKLEHNVKLLPKNTAEFKDTDLYHKACWPATNESSGLTLHYGSDCPGAKGTSAGLVALDALDSGKAHECSTCHFGVSDVGKVPAASTSIDNGYEYHLREYTQALDDYVEAENEQREQEKKAQSSAESAGDAFDTAISNLANVRPRIAPPGRYGCIGLVVAGDSATPDELQSSFASGVNVPLRGAVAGAVLAPEAASADNNVLSSFCSGLEERVGEDGAVGLVDSVMDLWGKLLVSYSDASAGLDSVFSSLIEKLDYVGLGSVGKWLRDRLHGVVKGLGLEAADMRLRKPVLTDTSNILRSANLQNTIDVQGMLRSLPVNSSDPVELLKTIGYEVRDYVTSMEFTLAEIPLPGGGSIPLTIRLRDLLSSDTKEKGAA